MLDILDHYAAYRPAAVIHNRYASNAFSPHQSEGLERRLVLANLPIDTTFFRICHRWGNRVSEQN